MPCDVLNLIRLNRGATRLSLNRSSGRVNDTFRSAVDDCSIRGGRCFDPEGIIAPAVPKAIGLIPANIPGLVKSVPVCSGAQNSIRPGRESLYPKSGNADPLRPAPCRH